MVKVFRKLKKQLKKSNPRFSTDRSEWSGLSQDSTGDSVSVASSWRTESSLTESTQIPSSTEEDTRFDSKYLLSNDGTESTESTLGLLKTDGCSESPLAMVVYKRTPPRPLPDSLKVWSK